MIRLGLCCLFRTEPIRFRRTTATYAAKLPPERRAERMAEICLHNARSLLAALTFCYHNGIGAFRINSQILPLKTHPEAGYAVEDLPGGKDIIAAFKQCGAYARRHNVRTSFHPDQFIVLSSPRQDVVTRSVGELCYHAQVASWVNADVINIHGGGAYGDKTAALQRLAAAVGRLPTDVRSLLTLENDDRIYTPRDLLGVCRETGVPLVYDVHHHRCLPDGIAVEKTTRLAAATWNREPLFHVSSPLWGWKNDNPRNHHDFIDPDDFPPCWLDYDLTVDVEAKAKELAVLRLKKQLESCFRPAPQAGE